MKSLNQGSQTHCYQPSLLTIAKIKKNQKNMVQKNIVKKIKIYPTKVKVIMVVSLKITKTMTKLRNLQKRY